MKFLALLFGLILLSSCTGDKNREEFNTSIETLKNLNQIQKIEFEMKIEKLDEQNAVLLSRNSQLENDIAALRSYNTELEKDVRKLGSQVTEGASLPENGSKANEPDDPTKPVAIVPEGESIVINPANSGGTRYLLVEIYLLRKDLKDIDFPMVVEKKSKQLLAKTTDFLTAEDTESLSNPVNREPMKNKLKLAYQQILGKEHPIKELIFTKWIMQ